jgi:hypothetical protein
MADRDIDHAAIAAALFNRVWELLEQPVRTPEQDDEMLHAAHASRHHWGQLQEVARMARGEWQCSRVYVVLERPEPALHHARRCLDLCAAHPDRIESFDLPAAHEALARAHALAGVAETAREQHAIATALLPAIDDPDDREIIAADLASIALA